VSLFARLKFIPGLPLVSKKLRISKLTAGRLFDTDADCLSGSANGTADSFAGDWCCGTFLTGPVEICKSV